MANVLVEETSLQNIANSIREKIGSEDTYKPSEMASAISAIETGGGSTPEKGLIIHEVDNEGYATKASYVGFTKIPGYIFYGAFKIESTSNDYGYLAKCEDFSIPDNITEIDSYAFYQGQGLKLKSLPESVRTIGQYAFQNCLKLDWVTLPSSLTKIDSYCFSYCSKLALTSLPNGLTTISRYAFQGCAALTLESLPTTLTSIDTYAFSGCKGITLSSIPSGVTTITSSVFYNCIGITKLTLEGDIQTIQTNAFQNCSGLEKLILPNVTDVTTLQNKNAFTSTPIANGTGYIYVPDALVDSFKSASNWSNYASQIKGLSELPA